MEKTAEQALEDFLQQYTTKEYEKGEILIFQGEVPKQAFVIKQGIVKAYNLTDQGDEKPISFRLEGEVLPPFWVYGKTPSALYFYEAFTPCTVYCLPRQDYIQFIRS